MSDTQFPATQWWQTGVIYQVYPRSFQDTSGPHGQPDGVGDLNGITARLDYLAALGVAALWISPFYPSPMADFGYDVADYTGVDPLFGTPEDFDHLLAEAHKRKLRVILDFVPNHSSDQHPWFLESRSSRQNPKRDWYLWRDAKPSGDDWTPARERLPNNWMSHFGGPAWTWDEKTEQFYLHSFLAQQPDLNWRNPEVRAAMYGAMRFWLDRGVDGFRMDVLWLLIKDEFFRDNPPDPAFDDAAHDHTRHLAVHNADQPGTHQIVAEMRALLDTYPDTLAASQTRRLDPEPSTLGPRSNRVLIGEIYLPLPELVRYYGSPTLNPSPKEIDSTAPATNLSGANLPFNFHLIQTRWAAEAIANIIRTYEELLPPGAWPNYVLGNHDQPRLASRIGQKQARVAAMLLLTLRGTPTLYYGDELGIEDVPIAPGQVQDPAEKNEPGKGRGRDPERSPMLWVDAPNAGFTTADAQPWLPLDARWPEINAATQSRNPKSIFSLYRHLLALRRQHDTLHSGGIADVQAEGNLLRYRRTSPPDGDSTDFQVLLNLGNDMITTHCAAGTVVLTTMLDGVGSMVGKEDGSPGEITLEAGEGLLIALD
ncbi:alpha-glucosidase [Bryocella elongata]|uniref:Alpha-glucosidase n=1 Tax=Bryocella elongata TaxID=863522 RepID=A0A1H5W3M2_9BACT|nr:alpha-amylase family glycosyl hydrolase [Bryocella elongata]SEF93928.1 alpha-glucosidase [Bryocella elongata]